MGLNLQQRKELLVRLGEYISTGDPALEDVKEKAFRENAWFIPDFIDVALKNIARVFLTEEKIDGLIKQYRIPTHQENPKRIGIVMAGNIPLVGFHDLYCIFLSGHIALVKPSSKDVVLIKHLIEKLMEWHMEAAHHILITDVVKGSDAYIATGSNNSFRYFEHYFRNYPSIIRKNRTSVAILSGREAPDELSNLADDILLYFGLGCRNVTKLYVPEGYDFIPLLEALKKYQHLADHNKYKNNYDYNLAILILNKKYYMTNGSILLVEERSPFSPVSQLNYEFYKDAASLKEQLQQDENIQCVSGSEYVNFGEAQCPSVTSYADGVDTMQFLLNLNKKN